MPKPKEPTYGIVFDLKLMRPGCVLLQAVGGDPAAMQKFMPFAADDWLVAPTPDMKVIFGTEAQWRALAKKHHWA